MLSGAKTALGTGTASERLKGLGIGLLLTAAVVGVVLLLLEGGFRFLGDVTPPLRVRDARIGERYIEGFDERVYSPESRKRIRLRFNRAGFRGPERTEKKPAGLQRIAVLGDSMIAGLGVEESDTLAGQLEFRLRDKGIAGEVLNFGVSASSPAQALVLFEELVGRYEPDLVISAFFVGNDLSDSSAELDHYPRIYFELREKELVKHGLSAGRSSFSGFLNRHSRFYVWQKRAVNRALHTVAERAEILPPGWWIYARRETEEVERAWAVITAVYARMRTRVEAQGARLVVVVLPSGRQIYADGFDAVIRFVKESAEDFDPDHPELRLGRVCREAALDCVFLKEAFRKDARGRTVSETPEDELLFFGGSGHFTPRGHALAAKVLDENLQASAPDLALEFHRATEEKSSQRAR